MTVPISSDLTVGAPQAGDLPEMAGSSGVTGFDVTHDGRVLAAVVEDGGLQSFLETPIVVVLNWRSELPQR
jgi:hypothetical protein